jgi:hypothetical protein
MSIKDYGIYIVKGLQKAFADSIYVFGYPIFVELWLIIYMRQPAIIFHDASE